MEEVKTVEQQATDTMQATDEDKDAVNEGEQIKSKDNTTTSQDSQQDLDSDDGAVLSDDDNPDGDDHDAVEADYSPLGSSDPMSESGIEMEPSDGKRCFAMFFPLLYFHEWLYHVYALLCVVRVDGMALW